MLFGQTGLLVREVSLREDLAHGDRCWLVAHHRAKIADRGSRIVVSERQPAPQEKRIVVARILLKDLGDEFPRIVVASLRRVNNREAIASNHRTRAFAIAIAFNHVLIGLDGFFRRAGSLQQRAQPQTQLVLVGVTLDERPQRLFALLTRTLCRNEVDEGQLGVVIFRQCRDGLLQSTLRGVEVTRATVKHRQLVAVRQLAGLELDELAELLFGLGAIAARRIHFRQDFVQIGRRRDLLQRPGQQRDGGGAVILLTIYTGQERDGIFIRRSQLHGALGISACALRVFLLETCHAPDGQKIRVVGVLREQRRDGADRLVGDFGKCVESTQIRVRLYVVGRHVSDSLIEARGIARLAEFLRSAGCQ